MRKLKTWLILIFMAMATVGLWAQDRYSGLEQQPDRLRQALPQASPNGLVKEKGLLPGDGKKGESLPAQVDLSGYLPPVNTQGEIGSCSAWSTVYYAKTLLENRDRGWGADESHEIFSPLYTYNQITRGRNEGTAIVDHMEMIVNEGCATLATYPPTHELGVSPSRAARDEAARYRAERYESLDRYDERTDTWSVDLDSIKILLASGHPVVVGFSTYENFDSYTGGVYTRTEGRQTGGHAMCVVGYDDSRGILKIVNSWGSDWGDHGFFYLSYDLFPELAQWGSGVLYNQPVSTVEEPSAPSGLEATRGGFRNEIRLVWLEASGSSGYIVYRSDNAAGVLTEAARTAGTEYSDGPLPGGVHYLYAVKAIGPGGTLSDFSPVAEGWTADAEVLAKPGTPTDLNCYFNGRAAVLIWDEVEQAEGYRVYRWDTSRDEWALYGESEDGIFVDRKILRWKKEPVAYYIVSAWNRAGESYATSYLSIQTGSPQAVRRETERVIRSGSRDDRSGDNGKIYQGTFYRANFFDYRYVQERFREFYAAEQKAFASYRQREKESFESWKKKRETPR